MVVDRGEIYAGFVSYLPERSAGKALLAKQSFGGVKDAITMAGDSVDIETIT